MVPLTTSGGFEVKSYYKALSPTGYYSFPWKPISKAKVPRKINCSTWTTTEGKILTMDNLHVQGLCVVDWCSVCKQSGESADHLLFHCCFAMIYGQWCWYVWVSLGDASECSGLLEC